MDSPLGARYMWPELLHLAGLVPGRGPAFPLILVPAFRIAAFEVLPHSKQHLLDFLEDKVDAIRLGHGAHSSRAWAIQVVLQDSTRTGLSERDLPDLADGQVAVGTPGEAL